ncbi:MAG: flagellar hook-associated protein FlgK [bacterium]
MSGLFGALEIGKRALFASQTGLQVTGQNIANANTPGYSRRVVEQSPASGVRLPEGVLGSGADTHRIARSRDEHVETRLLRARSDLGRATARAQDLRELESLVGDLGDDTISSGLRDFFDSWEELSLAPESMLLRQTAISSGAKIATRLNTLSNDLSGMRNRFLTEIPAEIDGVNAAVGRIAELSRRIGEVEAGGLEASDLRDQRGIEISRLSETIDVNVTEAANGSFLVRIGGVVIADGERTLRISLATRESDAAASASGGAGDAELRLSVEGVDVTPQGGTLAARLEASRTLIPSYLSALDEIAQGLATSVNAIHEVSYSLDGKSGARFFETGVDGEMGESAGAAARLRVASAIVNDARALAVSGNGSPGNNGGARGIAELDSAPTQRGGTRSISDLALAFSETVAADTAEATFLEEAGAGFVASLENRRDAVSGVSLDEEALNLIKYQQAYEAAARVVSIANEMMETLLRGF